MIVDFDDCNITTGVMVVGYYLGQDVRTFTAADGKVTQRKYVNIACAGNAYRVEVSSYDEFSAMAQFTEVCLAVRPFASRTGNLYLVDGRLVCACSSR